MGANSSKLEKALVDFPEGERYFGFENFGNTCYANSVLQSLYFCRPFRENLLQYAAKLPKDADDNLLTCLADLFVQVSACFTEYACLAEHMLATHMLRKKFVHSMQESYA